ncbi:MAG: sodium:proton antiporter, partial [Clostridia bacterium]|nr:sodium:proton antiporter [Clostridia bacterium]
MDILVALLIFTAAMLGCIITDTTMVAGLFVGYLAFFAVGLHRKVSARSLLDMSRDGIKDVLLVMYIMLTIGVLTATWRMSGTILYFVYYGVKLITPRIFLVAAFLLTCLVSYALGTSFGVSATVGVILMAIARSGGIHPALAAGAIFSGVYFGDRGSPVSSAATVVAALTETDMYGNVKLMHKTAALPF